MKKCATLLFIIIILKSIYSSALAADYPHAPAGSIVYFSIPSIDKSHNTIYGARKMYPYKDYLLKPRYLVYPTVLFTPIGSISANLPSDEEGSRLNALLMELDNIDRFSNEEQLIEEIRKSKIAALKMFAVEISATIVIDAIGFIDFGLVESIDPIFDKIANIEGLITDAMLESTSFEHAMLVGEICEQSGMLLRSIVKNYKNRLDYIEHNTYNPECINYQSIRNLYTIRETSESLLKLSYAIYTLVKMSSDVNMREAIIDTLNSMTGILGSEMGLVGNIVSAYQGSREATKLFWDVIFLLHDHFFEWRRQVKDNNPFVINDSFHLNSELLYFNKNLHSSDTTKMRSYGSSTNGGLTVTLECLTETPRPGGTAHFAVTNIQSSLSNPDYHYSWSIDGPGLHTLHAVSTTPDIFFSPPKQGVFRCKVVVSDSKEIVELSEYTVALYDNEDEQPHLHISSLNIINHPEDDDKAIIIAGIQYDGDDSLNGYADFTLNGRTYRRLIAQNGGDYSAICFISRPDQDAQATVTVYDGHGNSTQQNILVTSAPPEIPVPSAGEVIISAPAGGDQWRTGTTHTITWASQETSHDDFYRIEAIDQSGNSFKIDKTAFYKRSQSWTIPAVFPTGQYTLRLSNWVDPSIVYAETESPFLITSENQPPFAEGGSFQITAGSYIDVPINAVDANDDTLVFNLMTAPTKGTVTLAGRPLRYTANSGSMGQDAFIIQVSDGLTTTSIKYSVLVRDPALNPSFEQITAFQPANDDISGLVFHGERILIGNYADGYLRYYCLNGTMEQAINLGAGDIQDIDIYGDNVAIATQSENVLLFNAETKTTVWQKNDVYSSNIQCLTIGPDYVYTAGKDTSYQIKSLTNQNGNINTFPYDGNAANNGYAIYALDYYLIENGRWDIFLYSGGGDEEVQLWEQYSDNYFGQGDLSDAFYCGEDVFSIAATSDAIFIGTRDGEILKFSLQGNQLFKVVPAGVDLIHGLFVSGNEIFAGIGTSIVVLSATNGAIIQRINNAHANDITALSYRDNILVTGDQSGVVKIWKRDWNTPPAPSADAFLVGINQPGSLLIPVNDPDPDDVHTFTITVPPTHGSSDINNFGILTYDPDPDYLGPDSLTLRINDDHGGSADLAVSVIVGNRPPKPTSASLITDKNLTFTRQILANDPDMNSTHSYAIVSEPSHGVADITSFGYLSYTPMQDYTGGDSLRIRVTDQDGAYGEADYALSIRNLPPVALSGTYIVNATGASDFVLVSGDHNGDEITITILTEPDSGTVDVINQEDMTVRFSAETMVTRDAGDNSTTFSYSASDGTNATEPTTVELLLVQKINDADGDGIPNETDNCPNTFNPYQQEGDCGVDSDGDGIPDSIEELGCTDPLDADTDDDGIGDGTEDINHNGALDSMETNPCDTDTDNDGIQDGTESGYATPEFALDTDLSVFIPDEDSSTTTSPRAPDSDEDGFLDGREDRNRNGRVDAGESDPDDAQSIPPAFLPSVLHLLLH